MKDMVLRNELSIYFKGIDMSLKERNIAIVEMLKYVSNLTNNYLWSYGFKKIDYDINKNEELLRENLFKEEVKEIKRNTTYKNITEDFIDRVTTSFTFSSNNNWSCEICVGKPKGNYIKTKTCDNIENRKSILLNLVKEYKAFYGFISVPKFYIDIPEINYTKYKTGEMTYFSNELNIPEEILKKYNVEKVEDRGKLIVTVDEPFDLNNATHKEKALALYNDLVDNKILVGEEYRN
jgi:hypothetical protein